MMENTHLFGWMTKPLKLHHEECPLSAITTYILNLKGFPPFLRPVIEYIKHIQQPLESHHSCSLLNKGIYRSFKLEVTSAGYPSAGGGSHVIVADCTHLWKILDFLSLEKFSSCKDSWVRKATAKWK